MIAHSKDIVNEINNISGREFELYTGYLMTLLGFKDVVVTKSTGDYGVDVIGSKDNRRYGIQCKNYNYNKVGYHAVEEVCGGCKYYNLDYGIVLTNSTFSPNAINGAKSCGVCLIDRDRIIKLAQHVINQGKSIKSPFDDLLDQVQQISNHNVDKLHGRIHQKGDYIRQIIKRHKNSKDRNALLGIVKQIKEQKDGILKAIDKKKQVVNQVHKQVYLTLFKTYHTNHILFPNPNHINYQLDLKNLVELIKQMIDDYQHDHLGYVLLDYRRCYQSNESINIIKNRVKNIVKDIKSINMYYTTTKDTKYINRFCISINHLISNPILIKVYNLYYQSHHHCGDKRDKSMIKDCLLHRYLKKEFKDTYKRLDNKKLKQIIRTAKIKARNTGSKVSFLPIPQKTRISLSLNSNNQVES